MIRRWTRRRLMLSLGVAYVMMPLGAFAQEAPLPYEVERSIQLVARQDETADDDDSPVLGGTDVEAERIEGGTTDAPPAPVDTPSDPSPPPPVPPPPTGTPPAAFDAGDFTSLSDQAIESAGNQTTISSDRINLNLSTNIADVFRYEPGVSIDSSTGRFGINSINIRGLEGNRVLIQVDGIRVPDAFQQGPVQLGRDALDVSLLKQVDIYRGAGSFIYGEGAIGGAVIFETKDAVDFLDRFGNDSYFSIKGGYYDADTSFAETAIIAQRAGPWEAFVAYTRRDGHDLESAGEFPTDFQRYDSNYVLGKVTYNFNEEARLTFGTEYFEDNVNTTISSSLGSTVISAPGAPGGPPFIGFPPPGFSFANRTLNLAEDSSDRIRYNLIFDHETYAAPLYTEMRAQVYYQDYSINDSRLQQFRGTQFFGPPPSPFAPFNFLSRVQADDSNEFAQEMFGARLVYKNDYESSVAEHQWVYGVDLLRVSTVRQLNGQVTNLNTGATQNTNFIGEIGNAQILPDTTTVRLGMFIQDRMAFQEGLFWVAPGVRVNYYHQNPEAGPDFDSSGGIVPQNLTEWNAQPGIEIGMKLTEELSTQVRYQRGYRAPPVEDAAIGFSNPGFGYVILPNPNLQSETSDGVELGFSYAGENTAAYVNGYYTNYSNFIENVAIGLNSDGLQQFQQRNLDAQIYGCEMAGEVLLWGERQCNQFSGFSLIANYTYVVGDNLTDSVPLDSIPPMWGVWGLRYRAPDDYWGWEINNTLVQRKFRPSGTVDDQFITPGFGYVDVIAYVKPTDHMTVNLGVFNLFDKEYYRWLNLRGVEASDPQVSRFAAPGINFGGSVTLEY